MLDQPQKPRRKIFNAYVLFWIVGATFAAIYLAAIGMHPDLLAMTQSGPDLGQQIAQTQKDVERVVADVEPLKENVGQIRADVDTLKTAQQQASERDQQINDKVAALEAAVTQPKVALAEPPAAHKTLPGGPKSSEEMVAISGTTKPQDLAIVAPLKPKKPAPAQKSNAIETGSIKAEKAAAPGAATAPAKPTQFGLLLGSAPTVDAVKLNWTILNDRHGDAVRNLHPRYLAQGKGAERTYALLAGPVASADQAKTLCKLMADRGLACEVSTYRGTAF